MNKAEARKKFPYRPYSKYGESKWGGNNMVDDTALLLSGDGSRCDSCSAPTRNEYLRNGICPDCDGRAKN